MSIPAGYKCNQWGWFWNESDNSGPYYLDADGFMCQGFPHKFYTDNNGPDARLRVDQGSTSFYAGKEYRTFQQFTIAALGVVTIRATVPVDIILLATSFSTEDSSLEVQLKVGGTAAGPWTPMPVLRKSTMLTTPVIANQVTMDYDGNHTGGTLIDILRVVAGNKSSSQAGVGSERGVGPGTYYYVLTNIGNQTASVIMAGEWEERT